MTMTMTMDVSWMTTSGLLTSSPPWSEQQPERSQSVSGQCRHSAHLAATTLSPAMHRLDGVKWSLSEESYSKCKRIAGFYSKLTACPMFTILSHGLHMATSYMVTWVNGVKCLLSLRSQRSSHVAQIITQ